MDDLNIEALGLEIAGVDVHSLMRDLDEIELAVSELTLYGQFYEHFKEGFGLIQHAVHFWLEDGAYNQCAESTIQTMFRQRDVIEEHFSFSEATSLPFIIRQFVGTDHPASDSQLTATYALVQAVQAVEVLANWLFDLELGAYDIEADLVESLRQTDLKEYTKLVEKVRDRSSGLEIRSREDFALFKAEAEKVLMLASLYRQIDDFEASSPDSDLHSFMRQVLASASTTQASQRGKIAGKGNSHPESEIQQAAQKRHDRICSVAENYVSNNPKISGTDLVKLIAENHGIASIPTIRKYLRLGGYLPR